MTRLFSRSEKLVIASHNPGKVSEIRALLKPLRIDVVGAHEIGLIEPEETGKTFTENAELKARIAAESSGMPALADDSGMAISALGGAPGIYSARWAGPNKDFGAAVKRVNNALLMTGSSDMSCSFICVLSLAWPDGHIESFEGRVSGTAVFPPRGSHGFGYDPIFQPTGYDLTFGEMVPQDKHAMSHRAHAFSQLLEQCLIPA
ncbi:RdgB/HAM1 family non-canonical purine NTP pyrophosphatase [Alphaproteobacteria bacterium]|nr:RdgB/HAM1 family non-canonical purine NTP pyrophosphatase [Alphaproteobacteria bacterium]